MKLTPITGLLGATVDEIDLREELEPSEVEEIRKALAEYQVLIFRGQDLTEEQQLAFTGAFGPVYETRGKPILRIEDTPERPPGNDQWHADMSFAEHPPTIGMLRAKIVPDSGGDTMWTSLRAVFNSLSEPMQELLSGLRAAHAPSETFFKAVLAAQGGDVEKTARTEEIPTVEHPLVTTNSITGEKALYFTSFAVKHIVGLTPAESQALCDMLTRLLDTPTFQLRWRWSPNEMAMWDQLSVNHRGLSDHFYRGPQHRVCFASRAIAEPPLAIL